MWKVQQVRQWPTSGAQRRGFKSRDVAEKLGRREKTELLACGYSLIAKDKRKGQHKSAEAASQHGERQDRQRTGAVLGNRRRGGANDTCAGAEHFDPFAERSACRD